MSETAGGSPRLGSAENKSLSAAGGGGQLQNLAVKENVLIELVFKSTVIPPDKRVEGRKATTGAPAVVRALAALPIQPSELQFLSGLSAQLESEGSVQSFSFDSTERILFYRVERFLSENSTGAIRWLAECYNRATEEYASNYPALTLLLQQLGGGVQEKLGNLRHLLVRHAALVLTCPEVFGAEGVNVSQGVQSIQSLFYEANPAVYYAFFGPFLSVLEEEESNGLADSDKLPSGIIAAYFGPVFDALSDNLRGRTLLDPKANHLKIFTYLIQFKSLAGVCVARKSFFPDASNHSLFRAGCAWTYQTESLLGHILQPSTLDIPIVGPGERSARTRFTGNMSNIQLATRTARQEMDLWIESATGILKSLCKVDRVAVLRWVGAVLDSNEPRATIAAEASVAAAALSFPGMEALALKARGFCSSGFGLNLFWALLKLAEPIKVEKIADIDPYINLRSRDKTVKLLLGRMLTDSKMGDEDALQSAKEIYKTTAEFDNEVKFPSWVFWLTLKGTKALLRPALAEFEHLVRRIQETQSALQAEGRQSEADPALESAYSEYHCWLSILFHPKFLSAWWHFCNLALTFFLRAAYVHDAEGREFKQTADFINNRILSFPSTAARGLAHRSAYVATVVEWLTPPAGSKGPSPQFSSLPSEFPNDVMDGVKFYISSSLDEVFSSADVDLLVASSIFILANASYVRNPHSRWSSAAKTLFILLSNEGLKGRVEMSELTTRHLIPAVIDGFIDAQQAGFYGRVEQRLLYLRQLEKLLPLDTYKKRLARYTEQQSENFLKFVHSFVGNMSWVLDEAMSFLAEIKKRQTRPDAERRTAAATASNNLSGNRNDTGRNNASRQRQQDSDEDVMASAGLEGENNVEEMNLEDVERTCKDLMDGGVRSVRVFALICEQTGRKITHSNLILPQVVTSLNCCLDHLVGPRCLELKVANYEQYNFNPRELLAKLCESYVALSGLLKRKKGTVGTLEVEDTAESKLLLVEICNEGRYFKPSTFRKAHDISRREGLLSARLNEAFGILTRKLQEACAERELQEDVLANLDEEIPEEFLDPIMQELMDDPVKLTTSGHVMDRRHIERHLMDEEFDPFNRQPLKKEDLESLPELKEQIAKWLLEVTQKRREANSATAAAADGNA